MTKVLVVEDNLTLLEDIALELEMRGYDVVWATDGNGALNILRTTEQLPDIIVSDIAMPDIDGFKLLEHLRSNREWTAIPFLFLTAFNSPNSVRISKELGADDYIVKPFQADDLVLAMESKLKRVKAFQVQAEQQLAEARRTLLHMMSHELRSPLTAIYGGADVLIDCIEDVPDETVHRMVNLIRNGANRLNRFTSKALALLDVDSGNLHRMFSQSSRVTNVNDVIRAAIYTVEAENIEDEREVTIKVKAEVTDLKVQGVEAYLIMMVEELLRNAVAFTQDGDTVEIAVNSDADMVHIAIQDHGAGIAENDLYRVWDRFDQIGLEHHKQLGGGLGLFIVRDIAHIHGGDCTIASELGQGTHVTLSLPLVNKGGQYVHNTQNA